MEPATSVENRKTKKQKADMLRSISKQFGETAESEIRYETTMVYTN